MIHGLISRLHVAMNVKDRTPGYIKRQGDDVTDDISRLMQPNLIRILQELPKSPTRNIKANYEKYRTLNEYNRNLRSMTRYDKSTESVLDIPKISSKIYREQITSSIVRVGG